ncbi:hypothetical protein Aperf_G00000129928 [Anoplocephala perfoliata]
MSELTERERWRCFASARIAQSVEHQTFNLRVQGSSPCSGAFTGGGCSCCNLRLVGFCAYTSTAAEGHFAPLASHTSHLIPPTPNSSISSSPASSFSSPSPSPPSTCIYRSRVYPQTPTFAAGPSMVLLTMPRSSTHAFSLSSLPSPPAPPPPPLPSFLPSFFPSSTSVPSRPRSRSHSHFPPPFILSLYDELSGCLTVLGQSAEWRSGSVLGP